METKQKQKARQVIKELDFSSEGCAVSLVGPSVGGAANNFRTLIFKSALNKESGDTVTNVADKPDDSAISGIEKQVEPIGSVSTKHKENKNMDEIVELQKSLATQTEMLQKALDQIKTFETEKKEAIAKGRKAEIVSAVKDETKSEVLFKALKDSTDEDFTAVVKALKEISAAVEKSELFAEKGVQVDNIESQPTESAVMKAAKARIAKAVK